MPCLGRLLKTEKTVVASLPNLFVSPSVFLFCSSLGQTQVSGVHWATWACFFTDLSFLGDTASVLSSAVSLLYFEEAPLITSLWWPLECFHVGSATNLPTWHQSMNFFFYNCKQKKWHNFLGFLPSYIWFIQETENTLVDNLQILEIEKGNPCIVYSVIDLKTGALRIIPLQLQLNSYRKIFVLLVITGC